MKDWLNKTTYFLIIILFISGNALSDEKTEKSLLINSVTISDTSVFQWTPYLEWSIQNPTYSVNPFDLEARVNFSHTKSGETHSTGMFYTKDNVWKFRFTGTRTGEWSFVTHSEDIDLNGLTGKVIVHLNPDPDIAGFVTNFGNKWGRMGVNKAFIPQLVMYKNPSEFYNESEKLEADIQTFIYEHGFNGFHTILGCRWFDINQPTSDSISIANPDIRTFEALELLIKKTHQAGGIVHIWAWGDDERKQTPKRWGLNSPEDKRLQKYIAARLGPLPGWTMSYGFDLHEWVVDENLKTWRDYMHEQLGWFHFLGGRKPNPTSDNSNLTHINENLDYCSYEQFKPSYNQYIDIIFIHPDRPSFSEDRFRIRGKYDKDYTMKEIRRGLWQSAMAGGVANIWGNLLSSTTNNMVDGNLFGSEPFSKPEWIKTYSTFFENRFLKDMIADTNITDGVSLIALSSSNLLFYKEDAVSINMNLTNILYLKYAVAVDTKLPYSEIEIDTLKKGFQTWEAPYNSDWALAIGNFDSEEEQYFEPSTSKSQNHFKLYPNYPNPFNAGTVVTIFLSTQTDYIFSIYDVTGRIIKQTKEYNTDAGFKTIRWNGSDNAGMDAPSGIYLYSLKSGDYYISKKMIKLK